MQKNVKKQPFLKSKWLKYPLRLNTLVDFTLILYFESYTVYVYYNKTRIYILDSKTETNTVALFYSTSRSPPTEGSAASLLRTWGRGSWQLSQSRQMS